MSLSNKPQRTALSMPSPMIMPFAFCCAIPLGCAFQVRLRPLRGVSACVREPNPSPASRNASVGLGEGFFDALLQFRRRTSSYLCGRIPLRNRINSTTLNVCYLPVEGGAGAYPVPPNLAGAVLRVYLCR